MKIKSIDLTLLDVPFTPHTDKHLKYWLPHWHIVQICRLTMDNGIVGIGETIPNYTWCKVPADIEERIVGPAHPVCQLVLQLLPDRLVVGLRAQIA